MRSSTVSNIDLLSRSAGDQPLGQFIRAHHWFPINGRSDYGCVGRSRIFAFQPECWAGAPRPRQPRDRLKQTNAVRPRTARSPSRIMAEVSVVCTPPASKLAETRRRTSRSAENAAIKDPKTTSRRPTCASFRGGEVRRRSGCPGAGGSGKDVTGNPPPKCVARSRMAVLGFPENTAQRRVRQSCCTSASVL